MFQVKSKKNKKIDVFTPISKPLFLHCDHFDRGSDHSISLCHLSWQQFNFDVTLLQEILKSTLSIDKDGFVNIASS